VQKTSEEALRRGLEAQRSAAAARAKIPTAICTPTYGVCSLAGHDPVEGFIRSTVGHLLHCGFITSTASLSLGTPLSIEVAVGVLTESFVSSHPYTSEVMSIARTIVGHLVVGRE
jgi:hypothetical protein